MTPGSHNAHVCRSSLNSEAKRCMYIHSLLTLVIPCFIAPSRSNLSLCWVLELLGRWIACRVLMAWCQKWVALTIPRSWRSRNSRSETTGFPFRTLRIWSGDFSDPQISLGRLCCWGCCLEKKAVRFLDFVRWKVEGILQKWWNI